MKRIMKKIFILIMFVVLVFFLIMTLSGCNYEFIDLNYNFKKVHVCETGKCYEIKNWRDYEDGDQIQVEIKDYGTCLFYSNQIILIEDKCPICDE